MHISYRVAPSWSDGYKVTVQLTDRPIIHAYVDRLKYAPPESDPQWGIEPVPSHKPVGNPRVIMEAADVALLGEVLENVRVRVASRERTVVYDGVLYAMSISDAAYEVSITWGDPLPKELSDLQPVFEVLDKYAKKSLA